MQRYFHLDARELETVIIGYKSNLEPAKVAEQIIAYDARGVNDQAREYLVKKIEAHFNNFRRVKKHHSGSSDKNGTREHFDGHRVGREERISGERLGSCNITEKLATHTDVLGFREL